MILITGGLGFIGTHTARAVLELGGECLLVQRRAPELPGILAGEAGPRLAAEQVDISDLDALLALGEQYKITGIIHLAGSVPWPPGAWEPVEGARLALHSLLNVLEAARHWQVQRVCAASTIGVYGGVTQPPPYREDMPLPMTAGHVIPGYKKIGELLAGQLSGALGVEVVSCRIGGIWGPLGRPSSPFSGAAQLVHAAVNGTAPDLSGLYSPPHAQDGSDLCYVRDCGRALALLQLAQRLRYPVYNVAAGRATSYGELAAAIRQLIPGAQVSIPPGRDPAGPEADAVLDITRLREDTGFEPAYTTERAVADYVAWLRAGNSR